METPPRCLRVLIVDDDHDVAQALAELLPLVCPRPMVTALAFDGSQAVAQALSPPAPPDVVILDMEMPLMNGLEAALAIRERLGTHGPLLIAVSGNRERLRRDGMAVPFHHALPKPVDVAQLAQLLEGARFSE